MDGDTAPALTLRAGGTISEEKRLENLHDFAAVIYCLERGKKSAEDMEWEAGRKIKDDVLREIILTFCGRNHSVDPLVWKLRGNYSGVDEFFCGYDTVDEKEGLEELARSRRYDRARGADYDYNRMARERRAMDKSSPYRRLKRTENIFRFIGIAISRLFGGS